MRRVIKTSTVLGVAFAIVACVNFKSKGEQVSIPDFDSKLWREDSISCNGYRVKVADKLVEYKKEIQDKSKETIKAFLGSPSVEYSSYRYFVEKGVQCLGHVTKAGYDSLETASIIIDFNDQNRVSDVRKITP